MHAFECGPHALSAGMPRDAAIDSMAGHQNILTIAIVCLRVAPASAHAGQRLAQGLVVHVLISTLEPRAGAAGGVGIQAPGQPWT